MKTSSGRLSARVERRWPHYRARLQQFWDQQIRLHQLYLDRHDVSGGDALDALTIRTWSQAIRPDPRDGTGT